MIALAGYVAIFVALAAAVSIAAIGIRGARDGRKQSLKNPVMIFVSASAVSFILLEAAILTNDFSIAYVANHSSTTTPFLFLFAGAWAALEGSIVLWGLLLAVFMFLVWRQLDEEDGLGVLALGVMGIVAVFWFGLMATAANPFAVCTEVTNGFCSASSWSPFAAAIGPPDGVGPNALLQNHILMAIHPPMLYVGYVGFTVPFSFAIAALWRKDSGRSWLDRTHRWSLISWAFLAFGIILGAWWSYEVLGWGGYWAWDPVENAALLPWLAATAFIHSAVVQRKRGMLQAWNFILVIATFSLTILGTFLTRSGVIASVHAFSQSAVGPLLLGFLALVVVGSLALFAVRAGDIAQSPRLDSLSSREGYILGNNLILTVFAFTVLFGTMYPLVVAAISDNDVAVGRPFFDRAAVPLSLLLLLTMGVGSIAPWRHASAELLWNRLRWAVMSGLVAGALTVLLGVTSLGVVLTISLSFFVIVAIAGRFWQVVIRRPESFHIAATKTFTNDRAYWGGQVSHIGLVFLAIALATTSGLATREIVSIAEGESVAVGRYCIEYQGGFSRTEPNRTIQGVIVAVKDSTCTQTKALLEPRVNSYNNSARPIGTPDVWTGWIDDVFIGIVGGSAETIKLNVFVYPFQWLLWFGGFVMISGGLIALSARPRRRPKKPDAKPNENQDETPNATPNESPQGRAEVADD